MIDENKIHACFGCDDAKFALHSSNEKAAKEMIKEAKKAGVSFADIEKEVVYFCYKNVTADNILQSHIQEQVAQLKNLWK